MSDWSKWEKELRLENMEESSVDDMTLQETAAFERALEKAIDWRIRRICLKIIVAAAIAAAAFLIISPLMNVFLPHPAQLPHSGVSLPVYLRAYYETVQPYTEIIAGVEQVEKRGFGRYTVRFQSTDHVGRLAVGRYNAAAEFQYGRFRITESDESACSSLTAALGNRFGYGQEGEKACAGRRMSP